MILLSTNVKAEVFVVTSNADSGVGTIREALTKAAANNNTITDYIYFNLPGISNDDLTINLVQSLPDLSSNLVIDATVQPNGFIFAHHTKVKLSSPLNNSEFTIFKGVGIINLEIYGLFLYDYTDELISRPDTHSRTIMNLTDSQNISIGAPDKGNLIRGCNQNLFLFNNCKNISLKANLIGWDTSKMFEPRSAGIYFTDCNEIHIGGDNEKDKNLLFVSVFLFFTKPFSCTADIVGNNFGVLEDEATSLATNLGMKWMTIRSIETNLESNYGTPNVLVKGNLFLNTFDAISMKQLKGNQRIVGNYYGMTRNLTSMGKNAQGVNFLTVDSHIGHLTIGDEVDGGNYINLAENAIYTQFSRMPEISNNKYTCIARDVYANFFPTASNNNVTIEKIEIGSTYKVDGKADPNATVEIYDSDNCDPLKCKPRFRIGKVIADNNGNWEYTTTTNPITYFISATSNQQSTEFKTFNITEHLIIKKAKCNGLGSVQGLDAYLVLNPKIYNSNGIEIALNQLGSLPVGNYSITLDGACAASTFEIELITPVPFGTPVIRQKDKSCGLANGSIIIDQFNGKIPTSFQWKDENGNDFATTQNIENLNEGKYTLYGIDENDCTQLIGIYEIKTLPIFVLKRNESIQPDVCGAGTGSIKNLSYTGGAAPIQFNWFDEHGNNVGETLLIDHLRAGKYTLVVKDQVCTNTYTDFIIPFEEKMLPPIVQQDILVCGPGEVLIETQNIPGASFYSLYSKAGELLQQSKDGTFHIKIEKAQQLMLTYNYVECESNPTNFTIGFSSDKLKIPSAFSPNGDGINDFWELSGLTYYPLIDVKIYNRLGVMIYQGYRKKPPFDGKFNGKELPTGVYYYLIRLNASCPILSGSLTLIR